MQIVKLTQLGKNLYFTGVDKNGAVKVGVLPVTAVGRKKVEWYTPEVQ